MPDGVLERLRRLVPSEFLVAWAVWTASARMAEPSKISSTVHWIVWAVYGLSSFVYVFILLMHGRWVEQCKDCRAPMPPGAAASGGAAAVDARVDVNVAAAADHGHHVVGPGPVGEAREGAADARTWQGGINGSDEARRRQQDAGAAATEGARVAAESRAVEGPVGDSVATGGAGRQDAGGEAIRAVRLAMPLTPSTWWLAVQAFSSMLAFFLLSAATGDIYLREEALMWVLIAVTPLFALFSQFVVPDGVMPTEG